MQNEMLKNQHCEYPLVISKFVHEIRNPLTLVSCELQMLTTNHPEAENWKEVCHIQEYLTYTKNLISEFSDYNNAGRLTCKPTDMYHALCAITGSFRPMFEYLGIRFITEIPPNLPEFSVDILRIRQAITNLLRNAEESISHDHGEIIFFACMDSEESIPKLHIMIRDNGCGITSEQLSQIGTPFVTFKENGTGLGISITRQIIENHGGTMKIESIPSKGTTVHLFLPVAGMK